MAYSINSGVSSVVEIVLDGTTFVATTVSNNVLTSLQYPLTNVPDEVKNYFAQNTLVPIGGYLECTHTGVRNAGNYPFTILSVPKIRSDGYWNQLSFLVFKNDTGIWNNANNKIHMFFIRAKTTNIAD